MNRRQFVSRVSLGAAAVCTPLSHESIAAAASGQVNVRFVGMMTFVERQDRSFLVATPGQHAFHHMTHTPFLMARAGSPVIHTRRAPAGRTRSDSFHREPPLDAFMYVTEVLLEPQNLFPDD